MSGLFDVGHVPFSTFGSWTTVSRARGSGPLALRSVHGRGDRLFRIAFVTGGGDVEPEVEAGPTSLVLTSGGVRAEACFDGPDTLRMRGAGGAVRFSGEKIHAYSNGPGLAVFNCTNVWRRYQFEAIRGNLELEGAYSAGEVGDNSAAQAITVSPGEDGTWELAIDEFWSTWGRPERRGFDACMEAARADFAEFHSSMPPAPEELARAHELASYVNYSACVSPVGNVKRPSLLMSKNWMNNVWSWDQCFNAMALAGGQPELAMDQMLTLVDHQDRFGAYPDNFNDYNIQYNFSKPPVHGMAFKEMLRRFPEPPPAETVATMYESLSCQADWWMTHRRLEGARLPYYLHGNDSGWDNSTMFASGVPLVSPDLSALLIVQMDVLAELAEGMGKQGEAAKWKARANDLQSALMEDLWQGDHFVARAGTEGKIVESRSLIPWLAIILGDRLPEDVRAALKTGIEGHLTEWGLATERVESPDYIEDGYWRGPIWAPSTYIAVAGLDRSGFGELADTIAERFSRLCDKSGFAENFNAVTGEPLRDKAYTWTSSVFLLLAERMHDRQAPPA